MQTPDAHSGDGQVTLTLVIPPTITGGSTTDANQGSTTDTPFAGVTIGDGNTNNPTDTLTIQLSDDNASLVEGASYSGPLSLVSDGNGGYTLGGTAAADTAANVTAALDALTLNAPATLTGASNGVEALNFTLSDTSSAYAPAPTTATVTADIFALPSEAFGYTGNIQTFTAQTSGTYDIAADGAEGGSGLNSAAGGLGAMASGDVYLQAGATLEIVVGGAGGSSRYGGGGGGGSFVIETNNGSGAVDINEVIAGGGGGGIYSAGGGGLTGPTGGHGAGSGGGGGGVNGAAGQGGDNSHYGSGGGGGGFTGGAGGFPGRSGSVAGLSTATFVGGAGASSGGGGGFGGGGGGGGGSGSGGGGGGSLDVATYGVLQTADAHGGNGLVTIALVSEAPCYCRGARILTERGEVPVEQLEIGDLLVTASGALRGIVWIGARAYSARFAGNNPDLLPIRFKAGSLADGVPARDLLVSPKHAMFLDGVLIPAEHLVNGATIIQEKPGEDIHYFHLELETHDVLIAEGALSESFVDDDSRAMFQNAHEFRALYPDARSREAIYCAPRVEDGFALDRVRRRLAERAGLVYPAATDFGLLLGVVERCDHEGVAGWALNMAFPNAPVCLDVIVDGALAGYAYAEAERPNGDRGFDLLFPVALDPSRPHKIELRRSADGAALANSLIPAAEAAASAA